MDEYAALFGKVIIPPVFRDYDAEDQFIENMEILAEYWIKGVVVVRGDDPKLIGLVMIFEGEAVNDNYFGTV